MKKVTLILGALALVLGLSQCRKPNAPTINGIGETQHVTLTSSFGGDGSKLDVQTVSGSLNLKWQVDDKINILSPNSGQLNCTSVSEDGKTGTFEGVITHNSGNITFTVGTEPKYLEQDGGEINASKIYLVGTSEYKSDGNYDVAMTLPYAILKLDLHSLVTATGNVTITAAASAKGEAETVAKVLNVTTEEKDLYVMIETDGTTAKDYTFTGDAGSYTLKNKTLTSNTYFTAGGTGEAIVVVPTILYIPGDFTVCASPLKKVNFAKGNLYWDGSSWKLEANQWDYRTWAGNKSCIGGTVTTNGTPANNCGQFKWGNPTEAIDGTCDTPTGDFFAASGFTVEGETWFTLSNDEWENLLGISDAPSPRANASSLRGWRTVAGVAGLVILPDNTPNPGDVLSGITTVTDLAIHGAVFLPAAGYRYGTDDVYDVGSGGNYWSSTPHESVGGFAYYMLFRWNSVRTDDNDRSYGRAVRLVR